MTTAKAWTAAITAVVVPLLAQFGIGADTTVEQLIAIIVGGLVSYIATWFIPNKEPVIE
jgi:hypothetical protein